MTFVTHDAGELDARQGRNFFCQLERRFSWRDTGPSHADIDLENRPNALSGISHRLADGQRLIEMVKDDNRISDAAQLDQPLDLARADHVVRNEQIGDAG